MIKVGFFVSFNTKWMGGLNYFRNLLWALYENYLNEIEPIIFTTTDADESLISTFPPYKIIRTKNFGREGVFKKIDRGIGNIIGISPFAAYTTNRMLSRENVQILSHVHFWGVRLPVIPWIPDFQYLHYPEFYPQILYKKILKQHRRLGKRCKHIILSSADAKKDFERICTGAKAIVCQLPFAVKIPQMREISSFVEISSKYNITRPYYILPNQFWKHKNHIVVFKALKVIASRGMAPPLIVCTGLNQDHRNPEHFQSLTDYVKVNEIELHVKFCGLVSHNDLYGLMRYSQGLLNPSYFEGWSTTVEEAKMFGLPMILSDIPLHREQAGCNASFFDPRDENALAELLCLKKEHTLSDTAVSDAFAFYEEKRKKYAKSYVNLIQSVVNNSNTDV